MKPKFLFNLTIFLFFFFLFLLGYSKIILRIAPTDLVSYSLASLGSAVGVSVSVPPNPYNTIAVQLQDWQNKLIEKEKTLNQKELELRQKSVIQGEIISKLIVALLGIIFLLVLINFYLDFKFRVKILSRGEKNFVS
jgi:hypothetical protein